MSLLYYLLIVVGCFFEGELTLIAASVAVNEQILASIPVVIAAWIGAFLGDWFFFELGKRKGSALTDRYPGLKPRLDAVAGLLTRYPRSAIFIIRFQIAMRMLSCFIMGSGGMPLRRFLAANAAASLLWAGVITWICILFTRHIVVIWAQLGL